MISSVVLVVLAGSVIITFVAEATESCGRHQELRCVHDCPPEKTCRNRGIQVNCLEECKPCKEKCVCMKGYYRNYLGDCITEKQCDQCSGNNEFFACDSACDNVCSTISTQNRTNCPIKNIDCNRQCYCDDGYARNDEGKCIPVQKCPPQPICCDNEVLVDCPADSPSDHCPKCEDDNEKAPPPHPCPPPACKCRFNYRRAENGTCIPTRDCPPFECTKPNEVYTPCPPLCPSDACGLPRVTGRCPFRIDIVLECNPKCQCKDDYGRSDGECVPFKDCPELCPENEEYDSCTQAVCRQQNCATRNEPVACPAMAEGFCERGCICKENYYRNSNGTCVVADECEDPKCCDPNEEYTISQTPNCPKLDTCNSIIARIRCDEPEVPGCVCKGGYKRLNETSPCIPMCKCPEMRNTSECQ